VIRVILLFTVFQGIQQNGQEQPNFSDFLKVVEQGATWRATFYVTGIARQAATRKRRERWLGRRASEHPRLTAQRRLT
jgi:hypothetical protein